MGGVPEEVPKGVFVSHSGAWHISGRNSKVPAKIFLGNAQIENTLRTNTRVKKKRERETFFFFNS